MGNVQTYVMIKAKGELTKLVFFLNKLLCKALLYSHLLIILRDGLVSSTSLHLNLHNFLCFQNLY